ncbi:hypothetical protein [Myxococcus sp. RHSTA-1-4]|uniref:hypothetical protein n=1 Tax=Myxococcus sp. RHSTA-1-4 TaxID=2874601 RepID=UPI001CC0428E|nr:hypothetical protein [Myxococcus sp. RHSTA-1-4]MBZ4416620.1 hypothetical protein [Myxococcus sp. RHSTA-1-4]
MPCDRDWADGQDFRIEIGWRKDDGKPLRPFNPDDPMYPYELRGDRFLFLEKGMVYTAVGRFTDREEGEAARRKVEIERPEARVSLMIPGPYLATGSPTCKVSSMTRMKNPRVDKASWILEQDGLLLAGARTQCTHGSQTKKVTAMSCDGMKNLLTDTVTAPCEARRIDTCVRPVVPGVVLLDHSYSMTGGTNIHLRVYDLKRKKRLQSIDASHGGGPETELLSVEDTDGDGVPELVYSIAGTGQRTRVLKWTQGRFAEVRSK